MGKKNNNQNSKFHPAKTPEGRRKQHFAIEAKKKQSVQGSRRQAVRNSSQHSAATLPYPTSSDYRFGSPTYVDVYPHFRAEKTGRQHPALICGILVQEETGRTVYRSRQVTHGREDRENLECVQWGVVKDNNGHSYDVIYPNPDFSDPRPMLVIQRTRVGSPEEFSNLPIPYALPSSIDVGEYGQFVPAKKKGRH